MLSLSAAAYIEIQCEKWAGTKRSQSLQNLSKGRELLPRFDGLPRWLDPENLLPSKHPLRDLKKRLESELANDVPVWMSLSQEQKIVERLKWLDAHKNDFADFSSVYDEFSTVRYWLTGSKHTSLPH